jgi:hypothetical protein
MSTALQLVNKVLRRLREDEVSSFNSSYTKLILDFVNETKREVEDAWNWTSLRTTKTITTSASTRQYVLTGAGSRYRFLDAWNSTNNSPLRLTTGDFMNGDIEGGSATTGVPTYFRLYGQDSNGDPYIDFFPVPDGVYTLTFYASVPQPDFTAITDTITVPEWPVVLGAWAKAISERGEDGGQNTIEQQMIYRSALSDAIAMDEGRTLNETTWRPI